MTDQPSPRALALDAAAQALNTGRYWLPAEAQAAVVDAVLGVYESDRNRVLDNLLAEADRIDATTYKTSKGGIAMSGMAAGIREAVRTFRSRSEEHRDAGYYPHCGSGDAGPTADQSRDEWRRDYLDLAQRHQAAAIDHHETEHRLQQEIDAQTREIDWLRDELAALHDGEEKPPDERLNPTPAQWLWRWNRATPKQRLDMAGSILQAFDESSRCFMEAHAMRVADGREDRSALGRVRAELSRQALNAHTPETRRVLESIWHAIEPHKETQP